MTRADVFALGTRYANAGHRHGGWLGCAPDVYRQLVDEARDLMRSWEPLPSRIVYITPCGNVTVLECELPPGRANFLPTAAPDESWRLHADWV